MNGEISGYCKKYYEKIMIFEGEYLNGKKNGKVKEYHRSGQLIYEGEYLNGKKNGKVKEYDENGQLMFEGEYFNGKKWNGKGRGYEYTDFMNMILSLV